jgi:endo-alpha-1,4-polygalactosaminidase (GH114 family)
LYFVAKEYFWHTNRIVRFWNQIWISDIILQLLRLIFVWYIIFSHNQCI